MKQAFFLLLSLLIAGCLAAGCSVVSERQIKACREACEPNGMKSCSQAECLCLEVSPPGSAVPR